MLRHADAQTPQIVSGTAYQHNGNHILSQTDARGKTVTHDIDENTDLTRAVTDPNGQQVQYAYDSAPRYEYAYNARGGVAWVRNNRLNTIARSDYDFGGRPRSMVTQDASGANVYTARVDYDTCGRLARFAEQVGASRAAYETTFGYDREDRPTALTYGSSASRTENAYDGLGRLSTRRVYVNGSAYTTAYAYAPGAESGQTTALVQEITQPGENHSYAYDNVGNIVSAARNGVTITYAYDALGQLIRVNDPSDGTWTYEYDCGGNILNKKQYAYTTGTLGTVQQIASYAYGDSDWKDKLTRFNGVDIAYDAIGNPIQDGVWTYTWENGRQLRRMACDATIAEFVYNADGLRVQKTVNGVATNYTLHGKNIVHMTKGNAELHFWYDAQNRPAIVEFNGTKYGYLYNLQGDVIGLIDSANTEVVKYTYDAWGKPLSVTGSLANTIGYYNPFRYRGYVYDVETGLYYLRSRYYNPSWGRFVNADILITGNLFYYCKNAPIGRADTNGLKDFATIGSGVNLFDLIHNQDDILAYVPDFLAEQQRIIDAGIPYVLGGQSDSSGYDCATFISKSLQVCSTKKGRKGYIKSETGITAMLRNTQNCLLFIARTEDYSLEEIPVGAVFLRTKHYHGAETGHGATFSQRISSSELIINHAANQTNGIVSKYMTWNQVLEDYEYVVWPRGLGTLEFPAGSQRIVHSQSLYIHCYLLE